MSAPDWPVGLPQAFLRQSMAEESAKNVVASEPSVGPAKLRRRTTAAVKSMAGAFAMTAAQLSDFEDFYDTDLGGGVKAFTFPNPRGGADLLCRITGTYKTSPLGRSGWRVDLTLEILP